MGFQQGNQLAKLADHSNRKNPRYLTKRLIAALEEKEGTTDLQRGYLLIERLMMNALAGDMDAIKYIFDRVDGKIVQAHTVEGAAAGEPVKVELTFVKSVVIDGVAKHGGNGAGE